ncbi:MAG TPA: hypothetical protein VGL18_14690 [Actinomycetota bacterium]
MKRLVVLLVVATTTYLMPAFASAAGATEVRGGGTGSFGSDLDGDGHVDGSQFGMGVAIQDNGAATGHFLCLMAGRSEFLGLRLMSVEGRVTAGSLNEDGSATFSGVGTVNLGNGQIFRGVPFRVTAWKGGPDVGKLQLTVIGAFDGAPGDQIPGNGDYDLPVETVTSGQIAIG